MGVALAGHVGADQRGGAQFPRGPADAIGQRVFDTPSQDAAAEEEGVDDCGLAPKGDDGTPDQPVGAEPIAEFGPQDRGAGRLCQVGQIGHTITAGGQVELVGALGQLGQTRQVRRLRRSDGDNQVQGAQELLG